MGDTTTPDAGSGSDGGTGTDGGVAAECAGLVPASAGSAFTFDVLANSNETCDAASVDGEGVVAAATRGGSSGTTWYEFVPNYGTVAGNFGTDEVFPQPRGFIGLWGSAPNVNVAQFTQYGEPNPFPLGGGAVVLGPASGSGAISLVATSTALTVRKHGADAAEIASATLSGSFVPRAAAEDASGSVLAITGSGTDLSGFWVDLTKGTWSPPFAIIGGAKLRLRPLLGSGIALQIDGRWSFVMRPGPVANPVPHWLEDAADLVVARGGKAYALLPKTGSVVGIVSDLGNACGSIAFPGVSNVSVGLDGTVAGATGSRGCTKFVWRNVLR